MSDSEIRGEQPRSPLDRLEKALQQKRQDAQDDQRKAQEWQEERQKRLQKARQDIGSIVAPTLIAAQKRLEKMGLKALCKQDIQSFDPSAIIRWGDVERTTKGAQPRYAFAIESVNQGEYLKAVTFLGGDKAHSEVRVPSPVEPAWIEEELASAIEASL